MQKTIRTGVYGLLKYKDKFVVIKKGRGPFKGLYDLPGGKIEHSEENILALYRELEEEIGLKKNDLEIKKLFLVTEDFIKHTWENKQKYEHIIAIIYLVEVLKEIYLDYIEKGGDSSGIKLIDKKDFDIPKTNILQKALNEFGNTKNLL